MSDRFLQIGIANVDLNYSHRGGHDRSFLRPRASDGSVAREGANRNTGASKELKAGAEQK